MATTRLYPPILPKTLPAMVYKKGSSSGTFQAQLNKTVSYSENLGLSVIIKAVSTDRIVDTIDATLIKDKQSSNLFTFKVVSKQLKPTQFYKMQIAFKSASMVGYYSTVGVFKCVYSSIIQLPGLTHGEINYWGGLDSIVTGEYIHNEDSTEKVYTYQFDLLANDKKTILASSGECFHDSSKDVSETSSIDNWIVDYPMVETQEYWFKYTVTTVNNYTTSTTVPVYKSVPVAFKPLVDLYIEQRPEKGSIEVYLGALTDNPNEYTEIISYRLVVLRTSSKTNYMKWDSLASVNLIGWKPQEPIKLFEDFTLEQGYSYQYAICAHNNAGLYSEKILATNKTKTKNIFDIEYEDIFLFDGERQLKIQYNPKISSFKKVIYEQKTDTIGSKYPFIFRNPMTDYKEFPISGLISMLMDQDNTFSSCNITSDSQRVSTPGLSSFEPGMLTNLTATNFKKELEFKTEVLDWLTNGKPKLFRSAAEGMFVVRLMNVSLTPNDTLGRMLHTFSATAYEIAPCDYKSLASLGMVGRQFTLESEFRPLIVKEFQQTINEKTKPKDTLHYFVDVPDGGDLITLSITNAKPGTVFRLGGSNEFIIGRTGEYHFSEKTILGCPFIQFVEFPKEATTIHITYSYYQDSSIQVFDSVERVEVVPYIQVKQRVATVSLPNFWAPINNDKLIIYEDQEHTAESVTILKKEHEMYLTEMLSNEDTIKELLLYKKDNNEVSINNCRVFGEDVRNYLLGDIKYSVGYIYYMKVYAKRLIPMYQKNKKWYLDSNYLIQLTLSNALIDCLYYYQDEQNNKTIVRWLNNSLKDIDANTNSDQWKFEELKLEGYPDLSCLYGFKTKIDGAENYSNLTPLRYGDEFSYTNIIGQKFLGTSSDLTYTNIAGIESLAIGPGVVLEIMYQENLRTYAFEKKDSLYKSIQNNEVVRVFNKHDIAYNYLLLHQGIDRKNMKEYLKDYSPSIDDDDDMSYDQDHKGLCLQYFKNLILPNLII